MKDLGTKALQKIQNLIVAKDSKPKPSPKKQKSLANFRPSKILQETTPTKHNKPTHMDRSPPKRISPNVYVPRERQIKLLEKQTQAMYSQLEQRNNYKVQNNRSFFLNQKNPKPPIYQRAEAIMRQREMHLEEKRQAKLRQKEEEEGRQYEQYLQSQLNKKVISKEEAFSITDRLYKDHYLKSNRLNQQKIDRYKEQSKHYRQKPTISTTSRVLYQVVAEKNKLQTDIINRFGQYELEKAEKQKESLKHYKDKYYPFKPLISDNSRVLVSAREDKSHQLSRSNHCLSCHFIKTDYQKVSPSRSPVRKSHDAQ